MDRGESARRATDHEFARFVNTERPSNPELDEIRVREMGYYEILRGEFSVALEAFEGLMEGAPYTVPLTRAALG
jgi:hypothetical protein